jgi:hypothetical protein
MRIFLFKFRQKQAAAAAATVVEKLFVFVGKKWKLF